MVENVLLVVGAFLVGSIPTGYLVGKYAAGIDIRDYGSGNAGASNVIAHVGMWVGASQGLFDCVVKGMLPVLVGAYVVEVEFWIQGAAAIAAVTGHNWSPFLRFTGGRGVATAIGALLGLTLWWELLIVAVLFGVAVLASVLIKAVTRDTGLWTLVSVVLLPVLAYVRDQPLEAVLTVVAIGVLMIAQTADSKLGTHSKAIRSPAGDRISYTLGQGCPQESGMDEPASSMRSINNVAGCIL